MIKLFLPGRTGRLASRVCGGMIFIEDNPANTPATPTDSMIGLRDINVSGLQSGDRVISRAARGEFVVVVVSWSQGEGLMSVKCLSLVVSQAK